MQVEKLKEKTKRRKKNVRNNNKRHTQHILQKRTDAEEMFLALWQEERYLRYMAELHSWQEYDGYARLCIHNPKSYEQYIEESFKSAKEALEWVDWRFKSEKETKIMEHKLF